jgi:hypothetical protein
MNSKNSTIGKLLTASNVDLYTVPATFETNVKSIYMNNASSSSVTFSLDWYNAQNSTWYTLAETVTMPPNSMMQITDSLWFYKGDKFRGLASQTDSITAIFNLEEFFLPTRR